MPHRRALSPAARAVAAAAAAGLLAGGLLTSRPAAAAPADPFRVVPLTFTVQVGPPGGRVTCRVLGDLRIPAGVSAERPAPGAVLATNGFGGSKDSTGPNGNGAYGARFAEQGYVTLSYSGLGFGGSSCNIYVDDPAYDGQAGSALVGFLGGAKGVATTADGKPYDIAGLVRLDPVAHDGVRRANDPRVAMIGGSYGGQIQFAIASVDPRLDAIAPIYTWNDLGYSLSPNNAGHASATDVSSSTPGIWKAGWQALFFALGAGGNVLYRGSDPNACGDYPAWICQAVAEEATLGYPSAGTLQHVKDVSVGYYAQRIRIPVLFSQGQRDSLFNLNEAIDTYATLAAQGNTVRMVWQSWGHTAGTPAAGELDAGTLAPNSARLTDTVQGRIFTDWMAHWLKDQPTDLGPAVRYFRDYAYTPPSGDPTTPAGRAAALRAATAAYAAAPAYPVGRSLPLLLSGGSALTADRSAVKAGSASFTATGAVPPTNTGEAITGAAPPQAAVPGTFAQWTGEALAAPLDVAGVPSLTVRFDAPQIAAAQSSSPLGKLQLFAKLYDVAPDGSRTLIKNLVSAVRVPDVTAPTTISLPGIVHRFDTGHRVQLVLAASDATYKGFGLGGPVTVRDDPQRPNVLALPVVSARAGTAVTPTRVAARPAGPRSRGGTLPTTGLAGWPATTGLLLLAGAAVLARRRAAGRVS